MSSKTLLYRGAVYKRVAVTEGDRYRLPHFNEPSYTTLLEDLEASDDDPSSHVGPRNPDYLQVDEFESMDSSWAEPWWKTPYKGPFPAATYRGINYRQYAQVRRMDAEAQDHLDRALARTITKSLAALSGTPAGELSGWERRAVPGPSWLRSKLPSVDVWVKSISSLLSAEVPVEVHISTYDYMEVIFGNAVSLYNAAAGVAIRDGSILVVLPLVDSQTGSIRQLNQHDRQEIFHEIIHAIDYARDADVKAGEPPGVSAWDSPFEIKAYFLSMADEIEDYVERQIATEKQNHIYLAPDTVTRLGGPGRAAFWFWKNQVGWTDLASFKIYCYDNFINPRWIYNLSPDSKVKVDKRLDDLWTYLEHQYGSPGSPDKTITLTQ